MTKEALVNGLNDDLNREVNTLIRYLFQASILKGHVGREVRELLEEDLTGELKHAQFLADKIVNLGGTPSISPESPPDISDWRGILQDGIKREWDAVAAYKERIGQAEAAGEIGLKQVLEGFTQDETEHAEDMERFLG